MTEDTRLTMAAKKAFDGIKILKGQIISIATCDRDGVPNVAPIGSMRIVDEETVHVLQGFLPRTYSNLKTNPRAMFSVCANSSLWDSLRLFKDKTDNALGYQVYCEYIGADDSKAVVEQESRIISSRVPFYTRGPFLKFCRNNLSRLLKFKIKEVRAIAPPE